MELGEKGQTAIQGIINRESSVGEPVTSAVADGITKSGLRKGDSMGKGMSKDVFKNIGQSVRNAKASAPVDSKAVQSSGIEPGNLGLAATGLQQTKFSDITNQAADSSLFGNTANGMGASRFGAKLPTIDTSQGLASSGVIGGIKLI